jgi:putative membrane protein
MVGISGICFTPAEDQMQFLKLTPLNLFVTTLFLLFFHKKWDITFICSLIFLVLAGFLVEVIGVKTGRIFGAYYYGQNLGFKLWDVPVVIGLNWFMLLYSISGVLRKINSTVLFTLLAAGIMTSLDAFIEPIAIKLDFWHWSTGGIPIQNYIAWYAISAILFYLFRRVNGRIENNFSLTVLLIQFLFFALLNVLLP